MRKSRATDSAEKIMRGVVNACADCDSCRFLMDENCLFFPELYRLYDREKEGGRAISKAELGTLADLCTFCGLCPCPEIRSDIVRSKTGRVGRWGLPWNARLLADVRRYSNLCGLLPQGFARLLFLAPQREQKNGNPYEPLLKLIPGLELQRAGGGLDCCGMGGNLGFKKDFYSKSLKIGWPLMDKIKALAPESIVTDCLSCRMQFEHLLPYPVFHPIELLDRAYKAAGGQ